MRLHEISGGFVSIDQQDEHGSLDGYVVDTSLPQLRNYLTGQGAEEAVVDRIASSYDRVGILRNLWVDEEHRGQGIGGFLMNAAIDAAFAHGAEAIILVSDSQEDNAQLGKSLDDWYRGWGFETIGHAGNDPVMILEK